MDILYAPWRQDYATNTAQGAKGQEDATEDICVFCTLQKDKSLDEQSLILKRYHYCYVILNRFPYNPGHLLVIPYAHKKMLTELEEEARKEIMIVLNKTIQILQDQLECQGINIGLNMGKAAGAGIPSHLHWHILPRWFGDTNFLPTIAAVKTISSDLNALYKKLLIHF